MNLLLDTHVLLWALTDDPRLSERARALIEMPEAVIYYSVVSPWEVQIKHLSHPDQMTLDAEQLVSFCEEAGYRMLGIRAQHVFRLASLKRDPGAPSHHDPFDRMLVCQASVERMLFLTHDRLIAQYLDPCIMAV